jgi:tetratricopeptide (TPR) repeat protein
MAHSNLGGALGEKGKLDAAVEELHEAIRLNPDDAQAHINLGAALEQLGDFAGSLSEFRKGHELGRKQPGWRIPSAQWVAEAERKAELAERLAALLKGDGRPRDNAERLAFAQMCYDTKHYTAAARLWAEALEADPNLAADRQAGHCYNAACAAALAAAGQGKDDPPPDDAAKAKLRSQALNWLKAERDAWSKVLDSGPPQARPVVVQTLKHWKEDPDLAGVRGTEALVKLPDDERTAWEALWADVDALLTKAGPVSKGP